MPSATRSRGSSRLAQENQIESRIVFVPVQALCKRPLHPVCKLTKTLKRKHATAESVHRMDDTSTLYIRIRSEGTVRALNDGGDAFARACREPTDAFQSNVDPSNPLHPLHPLHPTRRVTCCPRFRVAGLRKEGAPRCPCSPPLSHLLA